MKDRARGDESWETAGKRQGQRQQKSDRVAEPMSWGNKARWQRGKARQWLGRGAGEGKKPGA